uniref:Uncharacterized protein n=1 Tax=Noccaea caerulescens TaxID=107243 RepID=A0A1J3HR25_NOCCA
MTRRQKKTAKVVTGVMGLCIVAYIAGPSLYWHLNESIADSSCPPCTCDCSSQPLLSIPEGKSPSPFFSSSAGHEKPNFDAFGSFLLAKMLQIHMSLVLVLLPRLYEAR